MTSPRQRKKRLALKKLKEKREEKALADHKPVVVEKQAVEKKIEAIKLAVEKTTQQKVETAKPVAETAAPVVESEVSQKPKKSKTGLVELKPQDQVIEQPKEEVDTQTKE